MQVTTKIAGVRRFVAAQRAKGRTIGFVPTMGAFHEGHLSLMRRAARKCGCVVVSIFVNPTQFGPSEDFERYPRDLAADRHMAEQAGVDLVFSPDVGEIYPPGFGTYVEPGHLGTILEGEHRPGHFRGVATVVAKLFNIVAPDAAFFGLKDYQQLLVVKNLVRDLDMPVRIVEAPTMREADGLAMSSRNAYLGPAEREAATVLYKALMAASELCNGGETRAGSLEAAMRRVLDTEPMANVDYAVVRDAGTLEPIGAVEKPAVALLAVRIGGVRLIDNVVLESPATSRRKRV